MTISNRSFGARSMRHYFAGWMLLIGYDETLSRHDWWVLPAVKIWTIWIVCCSPAFPHLNDWSLVQPNRSLPEPLIRMCEGGFDAQIGQSIGCCLSAIDGIWIERFKSRVCSTSSTCRDDGATLPFTTEGRKTPHELLIIELHSYATTKLQDHHNSRW